MKINWYLLKSGKLQKQPSPANWPEGDISQLEENWFDIEEAEQDEMNLLEASIEVSLAPCYPTLEFATSGGVLNPKRE